MSGCIHMNPTDWCIYCAPEIADLRERAEKSQRERDTLASQLSDSQSENARLREALGKMERRAIDAGRERDEAQSGQTYWQAEAHLLRNKLDEAREDIKALAMVLRAAVAWHDAPAHEKVQRATVELLASAEQHIRDRRLLEVSDGE